MDPISIVVTALALGASAGLNPHPLFHTTYYARQLMKLSPQRT